MNPLELLTNLLTYESCCICNTAEGPLCEACFTETVLHPESRCYICNKITKQNHVCPGCSSSLRRVWWVGPHDDVIKSLIQSIKFGRKRSLARQLGTYFARTLYVKNSTIVVPVPTAPSRVRRRGFDQAVILAQSFSEVHGLTCSNLLHRRTSADQIGKRRSERIAQMKDSFEVVNIAAVQGATILLIDDVLTTGATLESAALTLRKAGAAHVDAAVIARHLLG